ncbi:MAG: elongation factor G [Acidobacteriota bacterium]
MKVYGPQEIRNIVLLGHGGAGKTTLTSAMLYTAKAVTRFGKVEDGTAPTDFEEDEIQRKLSISTALAFAEWNKTKVNILDAPGYGNFIGECRGSVRVSDAAAVVVSAVSGVEVMTTRGWRYAEEFNIPRIPVINKMDRENASFDRTLKSIHDSFGRLAVPVWLPMGEEVAFKGVVDLVHGNAHRYAEDESGNFEEIEIPDEFKGKAEESRSSLVEMLAEMDEALMEKYFDAGDLTPEEVGAALKKGVAEGKIFPVLCCSAAKNIAVADVLNFMTEFAPSPADHEPWPAKDKDGNETSVAPDAGGSPSAYVFKTTQDPQQGRISFLKVVSGKIPADANLLNPRTGGMERMAGMAYPKGKDREKAEAAEAGDIVVVMKLKETLTGDSLASKDQPVTFAPVSHPHPSISFAVEPKSHGDEDKIVSALQRIAEEDPTISVGRDSQTKEMLVSGSGSQHVEVVVARVQRRYGVGMTLKQPKVPYKETIKGKAEVHARHKKQTGGHGQFADIQIRMEPQPRGAGFEFVDEIFGGAVPRNFIPAVEKGMLESMERGVIAGYPVVDLKITLFDGGFHPVDSSEMAFKIAAHQGFKEAMKQCKPTLLEPIMNVEITVPEDNMGDVMGDLNSRRGRIQGMSQQGGNQVIRAQVPLAEMLTYASTLKSLTGGRGAFSMEASSYEEVPGQIQQKIIEDAKKAEEEED